MQAIRANVDPTLLISALLSTNCPADIVLKTSTSAPTRSTTIVASTRLVRTPKRLDLKEQWEHTHSQSLQSYRCACKAGWIDASNNITHYPGRSCVKPNAKRLGATSAEIALQLDTCDPKKPHCGANERCTDRDRAKGEFVCDCIEGAFRHHDQTCRLVAACQTAADCDTNAICTNVFDAYRCQCKDGYFDTWVIDFDMMMLI